MQEKDVRDMSVEEVLKFLETSIEGKRKEAIIKILEKDNDLPKLLQRVLLEERINKYVEGLKETYMDVSVTEYDNLIKVIVKNRAIFLEDFVRSFIYDLQISEDQIEVYISRRVK